VALYLLMGVHSAVGILSGSEQAGDPFWLGRWKMFTDRRPQHIELRAEGMQVGEWTPLALSSVFPNAWQEGAGYHRAAFWKNPQRVVALADHTCKVTGVAAVRIFVVRWEKTLASAAQPERNLEQQMLLEQPCEP